MKCSRLAIIALVFVLFAAPSFAEGSKWSEERLPAPEWVSITIENGEAIFVWQAVEGATKYSLDLDIAITTATIVEPLQLEVELGGTDQTEFRISEDALYAMIAELAELNGEAVLLEGTAKVKGMNPGKGMGPQNHPFGEMAFTIELGAPIAVVE